MSRAQEVTALVLAGWSIWKPRGQKSAHLCPPTAGAPVFVRRSILQAAEDAGLLISDVIGRTDTEWTIPWWGCDQGCGEPPDMDGNDPRLHGLEECACGGTYRRRCEGGYRWDGTVWISRTDMATT